MPGSGNVIARYTHGLNIDEPLGVQQGITKYFYHADGLGSIVAMTAMRARGYNVLLQTYSYDVITKCDLDYRICDRRLVRRKQKAIKKKFLCTYRYSKMDA